MQSVQLSVDDEIKALSDALGTLVADIKAKKPMATIVADSLPGLLSAVGAYQSLGADAKKVDNQTYLLRSILQAFEPGS